MTSELGKELVAALEWIDKVASRAFEQDEKLRHRGARTLRRISDKALEAIAKAEAAGLVPTLAAHIADLNAKAKAWEAEGPGRWASQLTTDLDHWKEYGITTAGQLDAYLDACVERERQKGNCE